jgi:hypothetical protein
MVMFVVKFSREYVYEKIEINLCLTDYQLYDYLRKG